MTTGRINQVATSSFVDAAVEPEFQSRNEAFASECGMLRPRMSFAIVVYHCSVPASAPEIRRRRKTGFAVPAQRDSISPTETPPRRAKGTWDWDSDTWKVGQTSYPYNS